MENEAVVWLDVAKQDLEVAKQDLEVAKHLDKTFYPKPLEIICYHCQQSAEKAVKALIIANGSQGGMPKKHDISFLLNQIQNMVEIPDEYYDYADTLTPYGVAVRYPNELFLEERHVMEAIDCAEKILIWVEQNI